MQIIGSIHIAILEILYTKWPLGVTGDEIVKHVQSKSNSTFNMDALVDYVENFENIGQIKELTDPAGLNISTNLFYLTPNMFMAISENSKNPNSMFSKKS